MKFSWIIPLFAVSLPISALADVGIELTPLREYAIPGDGFELDGAQVQMGSNGATIISNSSGEEATASCTIVVATEEGATAYSYQNDGAPTACVSVLPHPTNGVFIQGTDPTVEPGTVAGFTARIDFEGTELWKVSDQLLVDATPKPAGTGELLGTYFLPTGPMGYSAESDKLLGFTAGKLTIGRDEKFITQGHVVNSETGVLSVSGQTFGQTGVGFVSDILVRDDGNFIIHLYTPGTRGANFFNYDGRQTISFFNPMDDDWDLRYVRKMLYGDRAVHMLWTESEDPTALTHITVTNNEGAMFFNNEYEAQYQFANGETVVTGPPINMWLTSEYTVVAYSADEQIYLRFIDANGNSPGMASLNQYSPAPPTAVVAGPEGTLRLLVYDSVNRRMTEYEMAFEDISDFDPDAGIGDAGFSADVGIGDVIERVTGCGCKTIATPATTRPMLFLLLGLGFFQFRRRIRSSH